MAEGSGDAKSIFLRAVELASAEERRAFLDEACAGDGPLRGRVEALICAHDRTDHVLDRPAVEHLDGGPTAPSPAQEALDWLFPSPKPGALGRLGHYEVREVLGRGGTAVVLRAFDQKLHRVVAIKVLAGGLAGNGSARQRFVREARAAAAVTHDNVIAIHAVEDDGPVPYLVMQCIDGKSLQDKIDREGPLPLTVLLRIGLQTADGLAAAHRQGLVHRDIKPANILLENGIERVKITDFGLARTVDDASLTQSGYIAGTPLYMSPEQARGEPLDHRTDLFSLGAVLYALCTGHPPFRAGNSMAILKRVCEDSPRPIRETNPAIPGWLEAVIGRLLAKDPADRFASANDVAAVLSRSLTQLQSGVSPTEIREPAFLGQDRNAPRRPLRSRPLRWAALALLAAVAAGGTTWFLLPKMLTGGDGSPEAGRAGTEGPVTLRPTQTLRQHTGSVFGLAFSPNGKVLASGGQDRSILLWDAETWKSRGPLSGHTGDVIALTFSPDGTRLASVSSQRADCAIRLWDVAAGQPAGTLGGPSEGMFGLDWSRDGLTLATGGWDRTLRLWDVKEGKQRREIPDVVGRLVRSLSFRPDGRQIVTGGSGATALWDAATGAPVATELKPPDDLCPTFLPGGTQVAGWVHARGTVILFEVPSGRVRAAWQAHPRVIEGLAVSPDGRFLASVGHEGVAKVWATVDQSEVATLVGHQGPVYIAAFSPDGKRLATGGAEDFTVRVWDLPPACHVER